MENGTFAPQQMFHFSQYFKKSYISKVLVWSKGLKAYGNISSVAGGLKFSRSLSCFIYARREGSGETVLMHTGSSEPTGHWNQKLTLTE